MLSNMIDLEGRIASELRDVSADDLASGRYSAEIRAHLEKRIVLLVRAINLTDEQQIAFAKTIGDIVPVRARTVQNISLDPELSDATEILASAIYWHVDGAFRDCPPFGAMLSMRRMSPSGGQTEFADAYAAYEELPEDEKRTLEKLRVVHSHEAIMRRLYPDPTDAQLVRWRGFSSPRSQPLVWMHQNGRKSLLLGYTASHIEGMDEADGRVLLDRLQAWATQPRFVYRHEWTIGDLVIWNNTGSMHRVEKYATESGRLLSAVRLLGEEELA
jgi:alpha-ketoglutarate-dependent taurine dioxygenase